MKWLICLSILLAGCTEQAPGAQIQKHLEKHDPWVEDHFYVTIDFWENEKFEEKYEKSCFSPAGNYDYSADRITLHNPTQERWDQTLGILDHELVHWLFDFQGEVRGPFEQKIVQGPEYREMKNYMQKRAKGSEFDSMREDIKAHYTQKCEKEWKFYLETGEEVMGRMIDSLYSLYFGPYDYKYFPLTTQDLVFLEQYTYKEKPLFRKGIERYRIGMKMHEKGIPESIIQHKLEFATKFTYEGVEYDWPKLERDFTSHITYQNRPN